MLFENISNPKKYEVVTEIRQTKDYDYFKFIEGNREISSRNYTKLLNSMKEEQLIIPILVSVDPADNRAMIIDGQHRYSACKALGLPVYYFEVPNYGTEQMTRANIVSEVWDNDDYLNRYTSDGILAYRVLSELIAKYKISTTQMLKIFSKFQGRTKKAIESEFKLGKFSLSGYNLVLDFLNKLDDFFLIGEYESYNKNTFIDAFYQLYTTEGYDHNQMQRKLELQRHELRLIKPSNMKDTLEQLIYKVYSHGTCKHKLEYSKVSNKVRVA